MKKAVICLYGILCMVLFTSCISMQKMRYRRGWNISFERIGKNRIPDKPEANKKNRSGISKPKNSVTDGLVTNQPTWMSYGKSISINNYAEDVPMGQSGPPAMIPPATTVLCKPIAEPADSRHAENEHSRKIRRAVTGSGIAIQSVSGSYGIYKVLETERWSSLAVSAGTLNLLVICWFVGTLLMLLALVLRKRAGRPNVLFKILQIVAQGVYFAVFVVLEGGIAILPAAVALFFLFASAIGRHQKDQPGETVRKDPDRQAKRNLWQGLSCFFVFILSGVYSLITWEYSFYLLGCVFMAFCLLLFTRALIKSHAGTGQYNDVAIFAFITALILSIIIGFDMAIN